MNDEEPRKKREKAVGHYKDLFKKTDGSALETRSGFSPLHLISDSVEPVTITRRLTVANFLLPGISTGMFSICVSVRGLFLELTV